MKDFTFILDVELFSNLYSRERNYACLQAITNTFPFSMPS